MEIARTRVWLLATILMAGGARAYGAEPAAKAGDSGLEGEFAAAVNTFMEEYRAADEEGRRKLLADPAREPRHRFTPKFLAAAERCKGTPEAIAYWAWLVENGSIVNVEIGERAVTHLLADHLTDPGLAPAAKALARAAGVRGPEQTISDLTRIIDGSPHASVRAEALFRRGLLRRESAMPQARQDFERAVAAAPDSVAGKKASEELAATAPLAAGDPAPDLVGRTLSGDSFQLSALHGKIVLVDFWGMWCGPCVAQLPKLRKLHERFRGKPFEIVGVDSDKDVDALRRFVTANRINWTTVIDGGTEGPIAKIWRPEAWPASFLIDGEGVIRDRNPPLDSLGTRIAEMLQNPKTPRNPRGETRRPAAHIKETP